MKPKSPIEAALRKHALSYPESAEDFPWGERVVKVRGKVFVFMGMPQGSAIGVSVKLPVTGSHALELPFAKPTGYGLGKSGWVSAYFPAREDVPLPLLLEWIDESYRAVAPKTLVKALDSDDGATPAKPVASKKKASTAKAASAKRSASKAATKKAATKKPVTKKPATTKAVTEKAKGRR